MKFWLTAALLCIALVAIVQAQGAGPRAASHAANTRTSPKPTGDAEQYSPAISQGRETQAFFGDLHLHTNNSADAFTMGEESVGPEEAFRFARGEEITSSTGWRAKLKRPLDFLAVSDHAEYLGVHARLLSEEKLFASWPLGKRWSEFLRKGEFGKLINDFALANQSADPSSKAPFPIQKSIWSSVVATADRYNQPGQFTAFSAYEWTSMVTGDNLHRVVIFKDSADKVLETIPFSAQDSLDPEALWQVLERYERETGGEVLAIPHNGNLSNGRMFGPLRADGRLFDAAYARARARWEPLYEVTQMKGDSESHPFLSPTDEFANFERWDKTNIMMSAPKKPSMLKYEYARSALGLGLSYSARIGENPFKFGMAGGTDSHTGLSTTSEDNYFGKYPDSEPFANRGEGKIAERFQEIWELGASGLTGVWAPANTRADIFAAMKRREVFATTGTRLRVRLFGGWNFRKDDVYRPDYVRYGYANGVSMGGDLYQSKGAPTFMVTAAKDPDGANLDRIQIVKGWIDKAGRTHEKIFDVALSDGRKTNPKTGRAEPVGSTVRIDEATYRNTIGDVELRAVWQDPRFDPAERAFYYARVIEIPTPRWTTYDAKFFGTGRPKSAPPAVQERAYTSPIWFRS